MGGECSKRRSPPFFNYGAMNRGFIGLGVLLLSILQGCVKGEDRLNQPPNTRLAVDTIQLSGNNRLNSTVTLNWFGSDADGLVTGFEFSFDQVEWAFTERRDSTFIFTLPPGTDTVDIDFFIRAVDDDDARDPSPAYLRIPLKNTPPQAAFNDDRGPRDTALAVTTVFWQASDVDGNETITRIEIKANDGDWTPIARDQNLISFVADPSVQSGAVEADVYYGEEDNPQNFQLNGLQASGQNFLYLRAIDRAGAVSDPDTSAAFYLLPKGNSATNLWISGHTASITNQYEDLLNQAGVSYDLLNLGAQIDGSLLPAYWDPTIKLTARLYDHLFINTESTTYTNAVTGTVTTILNFMAPVVQDFTNRGGKVMVTTALNEGEDISKLIGPYPIDSLVINGGNAQARIFPDSALVPVNDPTTYPSVRPQFLQRSVVPIVPSSDADAFYRAQLTKLNGWRGSDVVAAARRPQNQLTQVFFALELHNFNREPQALRDLFQKILVDEF